MYDDTDLKELILHTEDVLMDEFGGNGNTYEIGHRLLSLRIDIQQTIIQPLLRDLQEKEQEIDRLCTQIHDLKMQWQQTDAKLKELEKRLNKDQNPYTFTEAISSISYTAEFDPSKPIIRKFED